MKIRVIFVLIMIFVMISGCSKTVLKSDSDPNVDLAQLNTFYVQKFEPDGRSLHSTIAARLQALGYQATSGTAEKPAEPVDAIVTYVDRWMWDITMYMLEITIQFHQPDTGYVIASGNSYRTSLVRKSPEYMIEEVLREMLGKPPMELKKNDDSDE